MFRVLSNLAAVLLYFTLALVVVFTWQEYACVFAFGCSAGDSEEFTYLTAGRILVFLNLWAMLFFVNADFFRNSQLDSRQLAGPVITSTVLGSLVYLSAKYILTALIFLILVAQEIV